MRLFLVWGAAGVAFLALWLLQQGSLIDGMTGTVYGLAVIGCMLGVALATWAHMGSSIEGAGLLDRFFAFVDKRRISRLADQYNTEIVQRTSLVREGIAFDFHELKSGLFYVLCARRTAPYRQATFQVANKDAALAWRDQGVVPAGEVAACFAKFQEGTWSEHIPGSN